MAFIDFESTLDKIAKMISRRHGVQVVFEGDKAFTDGKKITLPYFEKVSDEFKKDLNAFLDHELAHIKFTDFSINSSKYCKTQFVFDIFNALEDIRIEKRIVEIHPGMVYNIGPLRTKVNANHSAKYNLMKLTEKLIFGSQLYVQDLPFSDADSESKKMFDLILPVLRRFPKAETSKDIFEMAKDIEEILKIESEDLPKASKPSDEEGEEGDSDAKGKGKGEGKPLEKSTKSTISKELKETAKDEDSKFDLESFFNKVIQDEIKESKSILKKTAETDYGKISYDPTKVSIPLTTRFDEVVDYSSKGNKEEYLKLKAKVQKTILPIKQNLEKLLKAKENAKWRMEREQGSLNARSFAKMQIDKNYRSVFKDFTKTDTTNVAVQILLDQSGSMSCSSKMYLAQQTAVALAEALKDLNISFEVTGFYSDGCYEMGKLVKTESAARFNRKHEKLVLNIFKNFESNILTGLSKIYVGGNNTDGECVKWAALRLSERREKRKILLVLSDGMPSDASDSYLLNNDLKMKVAQIQKTGIEVVGFGIMTDAVKQFYPDYVIVNDIQSLPTTCMRKLSQIILKG